MSPTASFPRWSRISGAESRCRCRWSPPPPECAKGMVPRLVKNPGRGDPLSVPRVAAAPEPLLVTLHISPEGEDTFAAGAKSLPATRYVVRVDIGGLKGPLYFGGPLWTLQLSTPAWPEMGTVR